MDISIFVSMLHILASMKEAWLHSSKHPRWLKRYKDTNKILNDRRIPTRFEKIPAELEKEFGQRQPFTLGALLLTKGTARERYKTILEFIRMGLNNRTPRCLENVYFSCVHGALFSLTSHKHCHPRQAG